MINTVNNSEKLANSTNRKMRSTKVDPVSLLIPVWLIGITLLISAVSSMSILSIRQGINSGSALRFFPFLGIVAAAIITLFTLSPQRAVSYMWWCVKTNIPFSLFILISLIGASLGRFILGRETSYFSQSLVSLAYLFSCFVFLRIPSLYWPNIRNWMVRLFLLIGLLAGLTIIVDLLMGQNKAEPATVFLFVQIISIPFYFFFGIKRWLFFTIFLIITLLTFKNTAVLIALVTCLGVFFMPRDFIRRFSFANLVIFVLTAVMVLMILGSAYLLLDSRLDDRYSDGHTDFRSTVYEARINQFIVSPLWGQFFSAETSYFYEPTKHLVPTHSDPIDILAQGGLLGFGLFVLGMRQVTKNLFVVRKQNINIDQTASKIASWVLLYLIAMVISFSFNSILGSPNISVFFWVGLAFAHSIGQKQK